MTLRMPKNVNAGSHATNVASGRVQYFRSLSDKELFRLGDKAATDITDDLLALYEIRRRFHEAHGKPLMGYKGWIEYIQHHSRFSIKTAQRLLSQLRGKDNSKKNKKAKDKPIIKLTPTQQTKLAKQALLGNELCVAVEGGGNLHPIIKEYRNVALSTDQLNDIVERGPNEDDGKAVPEGMGVYIVKVAGTDLKSVERKAKEAFGDGLLNITEGEAASTHRRPIQRAA